MSRNDPPRGIKLRKRSACLEISWDEDITHSLSFEFLRVHSPSAEVRGHGAGQAVLQSGKRDVRIVRIEPVGHYALKLVFSDGHDSGLYSWSYLHELGTRQAALWQDYLDRLQTAGLSRDA